MAFLSICETLGFEIETYDTPSPPHPLFRGSLMIRIVKLLALFSWHRVSVSLVDY